MLSVPTTIETEKKMYKKRTQSKDQVQSITLCVVESTVEQSVMRILEESTESFPAYSLGAKTSKLRVGERFQA